MTNYVFRRRLCFVRLISNQNCRRKLFEKIRKLQRTAADIVRTGSGGGVGNLRAGAYELVHSASFPKVKIGKRILVPKDKLIEWLDAQVEVED